MREVGSYEAKTHLPRLLDEVAAGQSFILTKHGRRVARLVPLTPLHRQSIADTIKDIKLRRRGRKLGAPIRKLIEKGRM